MLTRRDADTMRAFPLVALFSSFWPTQNGRRTAANQARQPYRFAGTLKKLGCCQQEN